MTPLAEVMDRITEKGYGEEFKISEEGAYLHEDREIYQPSDLTIIKVYRFDEESDPAAMSVLYLIDTNDQQKGFAMNAYGPYSEQNNPYYDNFIKEVEIDEVEEEI